MNKLKIQEQQIIALFKDDPKYQLFTCTSHGVVAQLKDKDEFGNCPHCEQEMELFKQKE